MVFHLSEHFLENSAKFTDESGCFFLCSSRQVCTKKAYEDILPRGLLGSPLPMTTARRLSTCCERCFPQTSAERLPSPSSGENFAEFSKKCSERWKTMSAKEKSKFEDLAKSDKARYDREMKNYVPPKGDKKGKKKDPNAPKRPPSAFFLFCSENRPKIKIEHPGLSIGDTAKKLGEMWSEQSAKDKQPYEQKAAKLKEKYEKDIAAYRAKGKSEAGKKGPGRPTGSKKKNEPEDEEEEEEEEEEEDDEEEEEDEE